MTGRVTLLVLGVVTSLCVFVATYFIYVSQQHDHLQGSYLPIAVGSAVFSATMIWLNYVALSSQTTLVRFAKAFGLAMLQAAIFIGLMLFLLLNTIGS